MEITNSIDEIKQMYADVSGDDTLGALISGEQGTGKTLMASTAPYPILFYMFDPKGYLVLRSNRRYKKNSAGKVEQVGNAEDLIAAGKALVVPLWNEQSQAPTAWKLFKEMSDRHMEDGTYEKFATIVVDSLTFALEACTHYVADMAPTLKMEKTIMIRPRNIPFIGDYRIIYQEILDRIKRMSSFPVNLIFTTHVETEADEMTGAIRTQILAFKKLKGLIPPLFTEKYMIVTKTNPGGIAERIVYTQPKGTFLASSQLGLPAEVAPDFREIMKTAGLSYKDKPLLK